MRCTSATPLSVRRLRWWKESMSPTRPMMVRTTPLETNASPPTASTRATTAAMSSSVASGAMTTTMAANLGRGGHPPGPELKVRTGCDAIVVSDGGATQTAGSDGPTSDGEVLALALDLAARARLDDEHRREHHRAADEHPGREALAAEEHGEERREDRLHAHDDRGAGGGEL